MVCGLLVACSCLLHLQILSAVAVAWASCFRRGGLRGAMEAPGLPKLELNVPMVTVALLVALLALLKW